VHSAVVFGVVRVRVLMTAATVGLWLGWGLQVGGD
jgi:hypothetical protein